MWLIIPLPCIYPSIVGESYPVPREEMIIARCLLGASIVAIYVLIRRAFERQKIRDRIEQGICSKCGYDLRMTPERCPECGTEPQAEYQAHGFDDRNR